MFLKSNFLTSVVRVLVKNAGNAIGFGFAGNAIVEIWDAWNESTQDSQQKVEEIQKLAEQPADETRQMAQTLAKEGAAGLSEAFQQEITSYLMQVPAMVRSSMRRPDDPTGTSVRSGFSLSNAEDLRAFLPIKPARFKPGDRPLPGVPWELDELLGVGGFGEVWRAHHTSLNGFAVALKFCLDKEAADRLLGFEANIVYQVQRHGRHPGIVELRNAYLNADPPCLEYEYVSGGDLTGLIHDWRRSSEGISWRTVAEVMAQLAEIVGFAHQRNPAIVHRDLKPANILVQRSGDKVQFKIADFGIGGIAASQAIKEAAGNPTWYMTRMATGTCTPLYASPQQRNGQPADPRDDVYALGVIWYQAITGNLSAAPPSGVAWRARLNRLGMSNDLIDLLVRCFEDDPDDRPRDAAELANLLKNALAANQVVTGGGGQTPSGVYPHGTIKAKIMVVLSEASAPLTMAEIVTTGGLRATCYREMNQIISDKYAETTADGKYTIKKGVKFSDIDAAPTNPASAPTPATPANQAPLPIPNTPVAPAVPNTQANPYPSGSIGHLLFGVIKSNPGLPAAKIIAKIVEMQPGEHPTTGKFGNALKAMVTKGHIEKTASGTYQLPQGGASVPVKAQATPYADGTHTHKLYGIIAANPGLKGNEIIDKTGFAGDHNGQFYNYLSDMVDDGYIEKSTDKKYYLAGERPESD